MRLLKWENWEVEINSDGDAHFICFSLVDDRILEGQFVPLELLKLVYKTIQEGDGLFHDDNG